MHKIKLHSETLYLFATVLLAFSVAMLTAADLGISMIVAPAYLLSLKTGFLTFGQAEYVIQAGLFIVFCLMMRKCKAVYLSSFLTCLFYGAVLDLWRLVPVFNPQATTPGQHGFAGSCGNVCAWHFAYVAVNCVFLQNLSVSAGLRLFCQRHKCEISYQAVVFQDLL